MADQSGFSFGILRLLLFTAAVGAAFGVARVLPETVFAPILMPAHRAEGAERAVAPAS